MRWSLLALLLLWATAASAQPSATTLVVWQSWPAIEPAIAIDPLDGPEELTEKAEIIADRRDALQTEAKRLTRLCGQIDQALDAVKQQAEAIRDLAGVRNRRDVLLRQRQQALKGRRRALDELSQTCGASLAKLQATIATEEARHRAYLDHAQRARREETQPP